MILRFFSKHPIIDRIKIPVIILVIDILIYLTIGPCNYGAIVKKIYPYCQDAFENAIPCYCGVDLWLLGITTGIFILTSSFAIVRIVMYFVKKRKLHNTR